MSKNTILVVDDAPNIVDLVATVLSFHGFHVVTATSLGQARRALADHDPDLLVVDVMLPDGDGYTLCQEVRGARPDTGIVFLTARDAPGDRIAGLTYGGDDYITKPFEMDELVARVRAVLRRLRPGSEGHGPPAHRVLRVDDVELDQDLFEVRRAGEPVRLSRTEYELLLYLMDNAGRVLSREQIIDHVWSVDYGGSSNIVDTYIGYLRRKLNALGPNVIHTHRGFGYTMRGRGEQA
ncbi:DNA-binding response regulator [Nocardiopsis sp. TSRI0078]|uniref:response regulator transcription factor n=1 Tax=unclassified Nocardiopsis TaxID=2649073 RepID=UPI000939AC43|nr:response regulator transcription factor [Nocardiopsis sp. TSRI0078]OKI19949.1 DNA-binding response regulator [Nocardiopsis sp. TSRI0078]